MRSRWGLFLSVAALTLTGLPAQSHAFDWTFTMRSHPYMVPQRSHGVSASSGLRQQLSRAEADLARAYVEAGKASALDPDIKAAQTALDAARRDYNASLAARRADLAKFPDIARRQQAVKQLETELADERDANARFTLATQLLPARSDLSRAEWDVLGTDTDLAVAKSAVDEAAGKLKDAQAKRNLQLQQDPAVVAARNQLASLRQQLSPRH